MKDNDTIDLKALSPDEVPKQLKIEYYFDFKKHPFRHKDLFDRPDNNSVISVLSAIDDYAHNWLEKKSRPERKR